MKKILTVNIGSASKKYALYDGENCLATAHFEHGDKGGYFFTYKTAPDIHKEKSISVEEYDNALPVVVDLILAGNLVKDKGELAVAVRVVSPGGYFQHHRIIDDAYLGELKEAEEFAPLHITLVLSELKLIKNALPGAVMAGISDSAFNSTLPPVARNYALPAEEVKKYGIYRYGYHGLSAASAVRKMKNVPGGIPAKTVICHIGSGVSVTALENGASIDNSMGFTPLEGMPMSSRSGTVDAGAVLLIEKKLGLTPDQTFEYLNKKSGLLGIGGSPDIRSLFALEKNGDAEAKLALDLLFYKIRLHIGAYMAAMGGIEVLIFTGTAGERSPKIRARVCEKLDGFGMILDEKENDMCIGNNDGFIQSEESKVSVVVLQDDEAGEMAREAGKLIK